MYRRYEDPFKLQDMLAEYTRRMDAGADAYELIELAIEINDLDQRVNFAWQDDEYDCDY